MLGGTTARWMIVGYSGVCGCGLVNSCGYVGNICFGVGIHISETGATTWAFVLTGEGCADAWPPKDAKANAHTACPTRCRILVATKGLLGSKQSIVWFRTRTPPVGDPACEPDGASTSGCGRSVRNSKADPEFADNSQEREGVVRGDRISRRRIAVRIAVAVSISGASNDAPPFFHSPKHPSGSAANIRSYARPSSRRTT